MWAELALFMEGHFHEKERLSYSELGDLVDIFSKMNEVSLLLQGKQQFVANDNMWAFKWELEFY